ncbi:MAG: hypothetical protein ACK53L_23170 [Pirellulaceae bacterium]
MAITFQRRLATGGRGRSILRIVRVQALGLPPSILPPIAVRVCRVCCSIATKPTAPGKAWPASLRAPAS